MEAGAHRSESALKAATNVGFHEGQRVRGGGQRRPGRCDAAAPGRPAMQPWRPHISPKDSNKHVIYATVILVGPERWLLVDGFGNSFWDIHVRWLTMSASGRVLK